MLAKAASGTPKFLASTLRGVCLNKSVIRKVSFSEKLPLSNTSRNSQPSSKPWIECGMTEGKFHRSPSPTSSMKVRPCSSTAVMRARPASMYAHSASLCQCISRMPPGFRRMLTPASSVATGSSRTVTSRAQPPVRRRLRALAKENLRLGIVPLSVEGEASRSGFSRSTGTLCGPRIDAPKSPRIGCGTWFSSSLCCCEVFCMLGFLSHSLRECHVQYETKSFRSSLRVKNDFNIAIDQLIEFLKGSGRLREQQAMRNDLAVPSPDNRFHSVSLLSSNLIGQALCGFPPG